MKAFIFSLILTNHILANGYGIIDDIVKIGVHGASFTEETSSILRIGKLSKVTYSALSGSSIKNIEDLLALAVKEKKVDYFEHYKYVSEYKQMKNGDKLLLGCLKDSKCNLGQYTEKIKNTFFIDKTLTVKYVIKGWLNDVKVHRFIDAKGKPFYAKISEVVDLGRTIRMPYIGSVYKNANAAGFKRDATVFWKEYAKKYPETLSKNNINQIKAGKSPIVDNQWIKYNLNHKTFKGETLEHHHLNNTDITVGIPRSLHRGQNNKELMHVD